MSAATTAPEKPEKYKATGQSSHSVNHSLEVGDNDVCLKATDGIVPGGNSILSSLFSSDVRASLDIGVRQWGPISR
jgi:hypothetical protein